MTEHNYTEHYIAFLDILGFKDLIKHNTCNDIMNIFLEIKTEYVVRQNGTPIVPEDKINYRIMSDSICIFIKSEIENALPALVHICAYLQVRLLRMNTPILVRGGIAKGNLYYNDDIVYGQGLTDAYLLEDKSARYPRIIIPYCLIEQCKSNEHTNSLLTQTLVYKDFDAYYCVNSMIMFCAWDRTNENAKKLQKYIDSYLNDICEDSIREKMLYLKRQLLLYSANEEQSNA